MYCDAHNHLHDEWLAPHRAQIMDVLERERIGNVVVNGTNESDWPEVAALAKECRGVRPSFGLHPWEVGNRTVKWQERLVAQLDANPGAVIGEIGLDRWMIDQARPDDPRLVGLRRAGIDEQADAFRWQFALAADRSLPPTVHCLNAFGLLYDLLRSTARTPRAFLIHAYSGPAEMVPLFVKFGAYFSFNGAFLDPRKNRIRDVYRTIPINRLLVETDAPAMRLPPEFERFTLPPVPARTERDHRAYPEAGESTAQPWSQPHHESGDSGRTLSVNHPGNLVVAYEGLAEIRGAPVAELAREVKQNFMRLFR